ncbi:tryparedoxin-like protein [Leptomonas seymouri]|uniref:Tryparedoxin-like protein n=1 Tax=Leptomonas seymouri TaxID=5684 RepID=A0A0N1HT51_LEPSE|nr:tryparedoxin-like protein [Leptomonas seymouri]|eukprot:KPI82903.1 tryparedoxin-like protein [Leptomonas seymouri]
MDYNFFNNAELKLLRKDGSTILAAHALRNAEFVLVYFSAHWCPPCRSFTPLLKEFYETHHERKNFEVVFMSFDKSEKEMLNYFKAAHGDYYCLPFEDAASMKAVWSNSYGFQTIPTLLVFGNNNPRRLVTKCGRDMVAKDPNAEMFPWQGADAMQPAQTNFFEYIQRGLLVLCIAWLVYSVLTR